MPRRATSDCSPLPTLRAMTDEVPMLMPRAMLVSTIAKGKVNVIAATCRVLNWPMNPISSVCTRMVDATPMTMGAVSLASAAGTEP